MPSNYKQIFTIIEKNKVKWLSVNPYLTDGPGIYILTRTDEHGIKYAYVGQAKHVLTRLADHLRKYEHIDLSIKKYGLYSKENPYGYDVKQIAYPEGTDLDYWEKYCIKKIASQGYQLRNNTVGGQGKGKSGLGERKSGKGYYDGVKHGYAKAWKEVAEYFDKYLCYRIEPVKGLKKDGTCKERYLNKLIEFREKMNNAQKKD